MRGCLILRSAEIRVPRGRHAVRASLFDKGHVFPGSLTDIIIEYLDGGDNVRTITGSRGAPDDVAIEL